MSPKITYLTQSPHINIDASGRITCKATGYPIPSIEWHLAMYNGMKVDLSTGQSYIKKFYMSKTIVNTTEESAVNSLLVQSVQVNDWKINFSCIAANDQGSIVGQVNIKGFGELLLLYNKLMSVQRNAVLVFQHSSLLLLIFSK